MNASQNDKEETSAAVHHRDPPEPDSEETKSVLLHESDHQDLVRILKSLKGMPPNLEVLLQSQLRNATAPEKDPSHRR